MKLAAGALLFAVAACGQHGAGSDRPASGKDPCGLARQFAEDGRCLEAGEQLGMCHGSEEPETRALSQRLCASKPEPPASSSETEPEPEPSGTTAEPTPRPTPPPTPWPVQPPQPPVIPPSTAAPRPLPLPPVPSKMPPLPWPNRPDPLDGRD